MAPAPWRRGETAGQRSQLGEPGGAPLRERARRLSHVGTGDVGRLALRLALQRVAQGGRPLPGVRDDLDPLPEHTGHVEPHVRLMDVMLGKPAGGQTSEPRALVAGHRFGG